jgi:hypothetical protein
MPIRSPHFDGRRPHRARRRGPRRGRRRREFLVTPTTGIVAARLGGARERNSVHDRRADFRHAALGLFVFRFRSKGIAAGALAHLPSQHAVLHTCLARAAIGERSVARGLVRPVVDEVTALGVAVDSDTGVVPVAALALAPARRGYRQAVAPRAVPSPASLDPACWHARGGHGRKRSGERRLRLPNRCLVACGRAGSRTGASYTKRHGEPHEEKKSARNTFHERASMQRLRPPCCARVASSPSAVRHGPGRVVARQATFRRGPAALIGARVCCGRARWRSRHSGQRGTVRFTQRHPLPCPPPHAPRTKRNLFAPCTLHTALRCRGSSLHHQRDTARALSGCRFIAGSPSVV